MKKILDFSIRKVHDYKDTMATMKYETEQLARDRDNAILRLDKCIVGKEEMEVDLFQKFVTVLNEKKAKIRRLQETIEQQSKKPINAASNTARSITEDHPTNDQTRDDDDTDVEMDVSQNKNQTEEKATTSSNIGAGLFQDEEDTAPVIKRRRKQPSRQPVRTPSKPVLPEVKTTVKRTTSNASSTSTNSDEGKQSSSSTRRSRRKKALSTFPDDVEDLFGDMA
ncbi:DNA repair XRCC4-like isoform X2 [Paramuricea clavata]|nr:DNA repair XRCC4-like isoform X2 [Paramuricea clavata]